MTAQLIDARSDTHVWAEHYDRKMADVFAIQSEVAANIVRQLRANLFADGKGGHHHTGHQRHGSIRPVSSAKDLITTFHDTPDRKETLLRAIRLLDEAIARDSRFSLAYCWAAIAHDNLYWFDLDHTPLRLEMARSCVRQALALMPDLGEAILPRPSFLIMAIATTRGHANIWPLPQIFAEQRRCLFVDRLYPPASRPVE